MTTKTGRATPGQSTNAATGRRPAAGQRQGAKQQRAKRASSARTGGKTTGAKKTPPTKAKAAAAGKGKTKAKGRSPRKRNPSKPAATVDLSQFGGRVVSVFGPFANRALIEMPTDQAAQLFGLPLGEAGRTTVVESVERDLAAIRKRAPGVADSTLGASALTLAYQLEHPYNSATSKSMCARVLLDTMERLRDLAPPEEEKDGVDDLSERRKRRRARSAGTANKART